MDKGIDKSFSGYNHNEDEKKYKNVEYKKDKDFFEDMNSNNNEGVINSEIASTDFDVKDEINDFISTSEIKEFDKSNIESKDTTDNQASTFIKSDEKDKLVASHGMQLNGKERLRYNKIVKDYKKFGLVEQVREKPVTTVFNRNGERIRHFRQQMHIVGLVDLQWHLYV